MKPEEKYAFWLEKLEKTDPLRQELLEIAGNGAEITERFYSDIEFGTAGLRGICAAGTARMNTVVVSRAAQGFADYILKSGEDPDRGAVIAWDCRYHSREFSELTAEILAGNGIRVYLFPDMRSTPELSFAIRRLGALSGVNMTASHNPKEYNGCKIYWEDGAQISGSVSDGIQAAIRALAFFDPVRRMPLAEARREGLIVMLGDEMDRDYLDYVRSMRQRPDEDLDKTVTVVYTPLNGAGSIPMQILAEEEGYPGFHLVEAQRDPDPEFATVGYPNPEDPKGFAMAEALGREIHADVLIATDPDSDRMAVEIPDGQGGFTPLSGNQTGAMLIAYMAESQKAYGRLPEKAAMVKSIVTGDFGRAVCESYGIRVFEALTGFKNICGVIPKAEALGYKCFFSYEESIGCAPGDLVRDKDGICAAMLVMELAAYCRKQGTTIGGYLESLYERYGWFGEGPVSMVLQGLAGKERISRIMQAFREASRSIPDTASGEAADKVSEKASAYGPCKVSDEGSREAADGDSGKAFRKLFRELGAAEITDYLHGYGDIPASDVLVFTMKDGSWFAMRPSGTEPKLKFYYYSKADSPETADARVRVMRTAVDDVIAGIL